MLGVEEAAVGRPRAFGCLGQQHVTTLTRRTMMLRPLLSCAAGAVILALAASHPAAAQDPAPSPAAAAAPATSLAPTLAATHLGFSAEDHAPLTVNASAARMGPGEGKAAAIVGGVLVITGFLVGGDGGAAIAIGGAGLALFGLYIWQRGD
jgi:hypothetical protein